MKRRHRKPGTVAGLSGDHLGMVVRIAGIDYRLIRVKHGRARVSIEAEWPNPEDVETCLWGGREFPPGTPCAVIWWGKWFRPTRRERLRELNAGTTTNA